MSKVPANNPRRGLKRPIRILSIVNIVLAIYIFITPLLPGIMFYIKQRFGDKPTPYSGSLFSDANESTKVIPKDNRLVIPSILLDEEIHEGPTSATLGKGVWRWPGGSTPAIANNTVLAGHLFTYTTPAVFYNLNKVQLDEKMAVYWEGSEYIYNVSDKKIVAPSDTQVSAPTDRAQLTVYTCTPLWHPTKRLVIIGTLEEITHL